MIGWWLVSVLLLALMMLIGLIELRAERRHAQFVAEVRALHQKPSRGPAR